MPKSKYPIAQTINAPVARYRNVYEDGSMGPWIVLNGYGDLRYRIADEAIEEGYSGLKRPKLADGRLQPLNRLVLRRFLNDGPLITNFEKVFNAPRFMDGSGRKTVKEVWGIIPFFWVFPRTAGSDPALGSSYVPWGNRFPSDPYDTALRKAMHRVKEQQLNLGTSLGEGKQTTDMLIKRVVSVAGAIGSLKRANLDLLCKHLGLTGGNRKKAARVVAKVARESPLKRLANGWLELQFGWLPLYQDIYETVNFVSSLAEKGIVRETIGRSSWSDKEVRKYGPQPGFWVDPEANRYDSTTETTLTRRVRVHLRWIVSPSASDGYRRLNELGLLDPASVAWELTPWSFAVDWFLPIGKWLELLNYSLGKTFVNGYWSDSCENFHTWSNKYGSSVYRRFKYGRGVYTSWPSPPTPSFKNPLDVKSDYGWQRRLSLALALVSQRVLR